MNELAAVINQEYALLGREEHTEILQLCLEKKELMLYFLQMLEIFEKAGPELDLYLKSYPDKTKPVCIAISPLMKRFLVGSKSLFVDNKPIQFSVLLILILESGLYLQVPNEEVSCDVAKLLENAGFTFSELDYLDSSLKPEPVPSDIETVEQGYGNILTCQAVL